MSDDQVRWEVNYRHVRLRSGRLSSIGLNVFYPDRHCELCMDLSSQPVDSSIPEKTVALDEVRRLHDALGRILGEQQSYRASA